MGQRQPAAPGLARVEPLPAQNLGKPARNDRADLTRVALLVDPRVAGFPSVTA